MPPPRGGGVGGRGRSQSLNTPSVTARTAVPPTPQRGGQGDSVQLRLGSPLRGAGYSLGSPLRGSCRAVPARLKGCHSQMCFHADFVQGVPPPLPRPLTQGAGERRTSLEGVPPPLPRPLTQGAGERRTSFEGILRFAQDERSIQSTLNPHFFLRGEAIYAIMVAWCRTLCFWDSICITG